MSEFRMGEHEAKIDALLAGQVRTEARLSAIEAILAERRGERRAALWFMGTTSAVLGSMLTFIAQTFAKKFLVG